MDTNLNISAQKQITSIEILHLDEKSYGPKGTHTRREWRKECLDNLIAGKAIFESWQASWKDEIDEALNARVSFRATIRYNDGTVSDALPHFVADCSPYAFDFVGCNFPTMLLANSINFLHDVYFSSTWFNGVNFSDATFNKRVFFNNATFFDLTSYKSATFLNFAIFDKSIFKNFVEFSETKFNDVYFRDSIFYGDAYFCGANFNKFSDFSKSIFDICADFSNTKFKWEARFKNTLFSDSAKFSNAEFCKSVVMNHATFTKDISFNSSKFLEHSSFENAVFKSVGHFEKAWFLRWTPSFIGCQIDSTTLEFSGDNYFPQNENSEESIKNISFLKRLSDEHGQTDQALNFNAMELRAKRLHAGASKTFKTVTWLYEYVSDYGRSYARPLVWYLGLLACTFSLAVIHAWANSPKDCIGKEWRFFSDLHRKEVTCPVVTLAPDTGGKLQLSGYRAAFEYTLYRAAGVLDFSDNDKSTDAVARRLFGQSIEPWWMRFFGIFKAIASTALLFLAALGLRNKYRIK